MRDIIFAGIFTTLLVVFVFTVVIEPKRDAVMSKCLELGNSYAQCEKLFE